MMDQDLDRIFADYRAAVPDPEPSPAFMPKLWQAIEARQNFAARFSRLSRVFVTGAAAIWLLMMTVLMAHSALVSARPATEYDILADSGLTESISPDALPTGVGHDTK